ncbi:MAG: DUF962 domain-containing protein [Flavobacteriales bacterium]|nr:DUF962 domain-containing protein [Flavobacteriales bacterium]MCB9197794.1 DUF962 domain-containing protein [Flavobacteriales bacterium]
MRSIAEWLKEYGESHQNKTNKLIHWICVPAIFFSIYGLIYSIPFTFVKGSSSSYLNYGSLTMLFVLIFYFRLSFNLAIGMLLYMVLVIWGTVQLDKITTIDFWLISLIIFVVAWIGQFIGHHIEGKKPSFFKDLQFLLIGPAWVIWFVYRKLGIKF